MINISPETCFRLRDARKAAKVGQTELAAEVGCKQSAISMFEQGNPTKLNEEAVRKIADKFGVSLSIESKTSVQLEPSGVQGFCPNPKCPTNTRYEVDGRGLYLPDREKADPVRGRYCAFCGEILEKHCPNCGAALHAGAICSICGDPYIAS